MRIMRVVPSVLALWTACGGGSPGGPGPTVPGPGNGDRNGGDHGNKGPCTEDSPCVITTIKELESIGQGGFPGDATGFDIFEESLKGHYVLGGDIDASDTENWRSGEGFLSVGGLVGKNQWDGFENVTASY